MRKLFDLRSWSRGSLLSLAVLGGLVIATGHSAKAADNGPFKSIIQEQMKAFKRGDAAAAFGLATSALQQRYQTPDIFMQMVKQGYSPVYRPRSVLFGQMKETDYGPVQEVYLTGPRGQDWLALYSFEQQDDGSWRISGCYLTQSGNGLGV